MAGMPITPGFTEAELRDLAGSASFRRGRGYLGQVTDLDITDTGITATVSGTADYDVWLAPGDQELRGSCSCPSEPTRLKTTPATSTSGSNVR